MQASVVANAAMVMVWVGVNEQNEEEKSFFHFCRGELVGNGPRCQAAQTAGQQIKADVSPTLMSSICCVLKIQWLVPVNNDAAMINDAMAIILKQP